MISKIKENPYLIATILFAILLTAIKRWGVGSSVDPAWYMAVSKNVATSGNYLHFMVSKFTYSNVHDHMPLTYWVTGTMFKLFGISTFVAKIYPIFCSFMSLILVFLIGKKLKDSFFGLCSVLALTTSIHFLKWQSQIMHEVPLTFYFLLTAYFMVRGILDNPRYFYGCSVGMVLGILTKGPVIGAIPLALFIWILIFRQFKILKSIHLYLSLALMFLLLSIFLLPPFLLEGKSIFYYFMMAKKGYASKFNSSFTFFKLAYKQSFILVFLMAASLWMAWKKKYQNISLQLLLLFISIAVITPFSFYRIKFAHYIVPIYPFMAFLGAIALYVWLQKYNEKICKGVTIFSMGMIIIMSIFPIQITGKRTKHNINLAKILQFDTTAKDVYFYGKYRTDMKLVTEYSFYSSINIKLVTPEDLPQFNLKDNYLIVPTKIMPITIAQKQYNENSCVFSNGSHCALRDPQMVRIKVPRKKLPHEIFL